jgi:transcriptional regulator with XRE-family HTH domain
MATVYEMIESLCRERGITGSKMCDDLGISRSTMTELRKGRAKTMNLEKAGKIADYFGVSTDYLLGKTPTPSLTRRDERDIEKRLEETLNQLEGEQGGLMFSGAPMDDSTRELLILSLRNSMEIAKHAAKQKYTPKKYSKEP